MKEVLQLIYLTSDLHLSHSKSFIYESRGFTSIEEHDKTIIKNFNSIVKPEDELYILGDLMLCDNEHGLECLRQLNGNKHFVRGNHDTSTRCRLYSEIGIIDEGYATMLKYKKYHFYLSHYPTVTSNGEIESLHQVTCGLSGHTHSKDKFYNNISYLYNVAVDAHNCFPVFLDTIIEDMKIKFNEQKAMQLFE